MQLPLIPQIAQCISCVGKIGSFGFALCRRVSKGKNKCANEGSKRISFFLCDWKKIKTRSAGM